MTTSRGLSAFLFTSILGLAGCGATNSGKGSDLHYISWSESAIRNSAIADARGESLNVCLEGRVSEDDLERSKAWSRRAILTWLRVAKLMDEQITSQVVFSCTDRHLTIRLRNGSGTSFASPSVMTVYMTRPYGTWTHELGHALVGLSDTYSGGRAGQCQRGQPESLMCWGAYGPRANPEEYSTLWEDDVEGLRANFRTLFGEDTVPPDWADEVDPEAPLDAEAPWPDASPEEFRISMKDHLVEIVAGGPTPIVEDGAIDL